ncbi:hypothetical protein BC941DRAFT_402304 [Chlamydoabsidia padenii]|nr:hypothetical protein BC941DRAFT_402304 [Chlamydoabsidia padenii]
MNSPQDQGRRPRNAAPIPLPTTSRQHPRSSYYSDANYSYGHGQQPEMRPVSPSGYSEIEVVLDDGTLQRRTVSLSTTFDSRFHDINDTLQEPLDKQYDRLYQHQDYNDNVRPSKIVMPESEQPLLSGHHHKTNYNSINQHQQLANNLPGFRQDDDCLDDSDSDDVFTPDNDGDNGGDSSAQQYRGRYKRKTKTSSIYNIVDDYETSFWKTKVPDLIHRTSKWMTLTPQQRSVLKCSFAYFVGSLFTFVPALNGFIGNNRVSSHLVATATVFFNPAKTLGGMVEASAYGWGYTLFALSVCLGSMATTDYFIDQQLMLVAHLLSLLFWLAGATFIVSFLKAHWNKPPVATASSLCFIIIFIVVVREGSANRGDFDTTRIQQITSAVATGTLITITSCIVFWPTSATKKLQNDLETTMTSYKVLLKLLTKTFLLDDDLPEFKANRILQTAIESHRSSFTSLQKSLKEAKLERLWNRQIRGCTKEYDQIVKSMQRLSQHVGGLRSSCGIQFNYINNKDPQVYTQHSSDHHDQHPITLPATNGQRHQQQPSRAQSPVASSDAWSIRPGYRRRQLESEMKRQRSAALAASYVTAPFSMDKESIDNSSRIGSPNIEADPISEPHFDSLVSEAASPMLDQLSMRSHAINNDNSTPLRDETANDVSLINYIQTIRQPLKSLAYTCKRTIFHLQLQFSSNPAAHSPRMKNMSPDLNLLKANLAMAINLFETSQRHAIHRLQPQQQQYQQHRTDRSTSNDDHGCHLSTMPGEDIFLVYFFVFNMIEFAQEMITLVEAVQQLTLARNKKTTWWQYCFGNWIKPSEKKVDKTPSFQAFTPNERNTVNTLHTPLATTRWRRFFIRIWLLFSLFKLQKMRYAIKASIAAILLATPAFVSSTSHFFREWRMEWALITLMVVMTPTVGGTNLVAIYRIFSTMLGCFSAMFFYMLFPANMYALAALTWLFSIPNFWLILHHKHGKFGQFTLLAYNLVMLNKYNDRETNNVEVWLLAIQRCMAILVGVVVGLIATAYVWPYEARVELRKGLSDFLLRLSWLYQKLVSLYSSSPVEKNQSLMVNVDGLQERSTWAYGFMELELGLQRTLIELHELLAQTPNEPRLKGAFPVATYRDILASCQNIVDKFMSIRTVMLKEVWMADVQQTFVLPANRERREMVGNVLLYFYLLASALRLKTPLPPYLPPARTAWQSLIQRLRQDASSLSKTTTITTNNGAPTTSCDKDQVYMIYFAYVIMMEDIIRELDKLGENMTLLFGTLVPEEQWRHLFEDWPLIEQGMSRKNGLSITSVSQKLC